MSTVKISYLFDFNGLSTALGHLRTVTDKLGFFTRIFLEKYLFYSFNPDIILHGFLGSKHLLTKFYNFVVFSRLYFFFPEQYNVSPKKERFHTLGNKFTFLVCFALAFFFLHESFYFNQCLLELVSWCFEPSQPQRITSGPKTNFSLSPSYFLNKGGISSTNVTRSSICLTFCNIHLNAHYYLILQFFFFFVTFTHIQVR